MRFRRVAEAISEQYRLTIPDIARRLNVGKMSVYAMLEAGIIPGVRIGKRWIVTRLSYERWERTCGLKEPAADGARDHNPKL